MADAKASAQATGIGLPGLLLVLFVGLKLTGYITWSWLWVLSPLWLPLAVILGILVLWLIGFGIYRWRKYSK